MFKPIEKVSVAKRHLINPSWNKISMTSLMTGRRPVEKRRGEERRREKDKYKYISKTFFLNRK
jgi:hypothetical protein